MIQTLFNFLFSTRLNDVQNLNIFFDHFESQKTYASTTLKYSHIEQLICGTNLDKYKHWLIGIKEYEDCSLLYPLVKILEFTKHVSAFFHAKIEDLILKKKDLICTRILN